MRYYSLFVLSLFIFCNIFGIIDSREVPVYTPEIRSDVIVTKFPTPKSNINDEEISTEPGWMVILSNLSHLS